MFDTLFLMVNVNFTTALVVAALVVGSGLIFREMTDSNMMTAVFVPVMTFGALASIYGLGQAGLFFTSNREANAIMSSSFGMISAFTLMLVVIRVWIAIGDMRRPPDAAGRIRDGEPGA